MDVELRWLRSFVMVAQEGHFSRAAQRLNLTQPALTAQITQLETAVGARLFERTNRLHGLTPAGSALLAESRRIVERARSLPSLAAAAEHGHAGVLRTGVIPPATTPAIAEVFQRFTTDRPDVELRLRLGAQDALVSSLVAGDLDLVIGRPEKLTAGAGLQEQRLFEEEQGILLRRDDPRAGGVELNLRALDGTTLLLLEGNPHFGQLLIERATRLGVRLLPRYVATDFPSLHWMVQAGLGVAPCSRWLAESVPQGLIVLRLRPRLPKLAVHAIWRGRNPMPLVAGWLDLAKRSMVLSSAPRQTGGR